MGFLLKEFQLFSYRNSNALLSFDSCKDFVFIVTKNAIHQYKTRKALPLHCPLPFTPVFSCFFNDRMFLASKTELFHFKYELHKLQNIDVLSFTFTYLDYLITIGSKIIIYTLSAVYDNCKENNSMSVSFYKECSLDMLESNGLCSAYCLFKSKIILGFESGAICLLGDFTGNKTPTITMLECFNEPILSLIATEDHIFVHTIASVFRVKNSLQESKESEKGTDDLQTKLQAKKMIGIAEKLLVVQEKMIIFLDYDLKVIKNFFLLFPIVDIKVSANSLVVGFSNGLLCEYDLNRIISDNLALKEEIKK
ncbi:hypothetical protein GINT2_000330 [Glugoides intestinalis]